MPPQPQTHDEPTCYGLYVEAVADPAVPSRLLDMCAALNILPSAFRFRCVGSDQIAIHTELRGVSRAQFDRLAERAGQAPTTLRVERSYFGQSTPPKLTEVQ